MSLSTIGKIERPQLMPKNTTRLVKVKIKIQVIIFVMTLIVRKIIITSNS